MNVFDYKVFAFQFNDNGKVLIGICYKTKRRFKIFDSEDFRN